MCYPCIIAHPALTQKIMIKFLTSLLFALPLIATASAASFPAELCGAHADKSAPISEQGYVQIGGIKQWLTIEGSQCSNPVIIFVHGGPGNPLSLYSNSFYDGWEKEFTLVHWDQRGSGKTYEANQEPGELTIGKLQRTELTIDLLVRDALEVTDYIRKRLHKDKLILSGSSWGSVIAIKMVALEPEKFHFYVGLSQLVNYQSNMQKSYELVLAQATKLKDEQAIATLKDIGPPPWTNPRSFGQLRRIIRDYENRVIDAQPQLNIAKGYDSESSRAAYFAGEDFSFVKFVGLEGDGMAQEIALDKQHTEFKAPIYLIQGTEDLLTVPEITTRYFEKISAPKKKLIEVERAGHDPNLRMLEKQLEVTRKAYSRKD